MYLALGYLGAMPAEGIYLLISESSNNLLLSFTFIVILPVLSFFEKTRPIASKYF